MTAAAVSAAIPVLAGCGPGYLLDGKFNSLDGNGCDCWPNRGGPDFVRCMYHNPDGTVNMTIDPDSCPNEAKDASRVAKSDPLGIEYAGNKLVDGVFWLVGIQSKQSPDSPAVGTQVAAPYFNGNLSHNQSVLNWVAGVRPDLATMQINTGEIIDTGLKVVAGGGSAALALWGIAAFKSSLAATGAEMLIGGEILVGTLGLVAVAGIAIAGVTLVKALK